MNQTVNDQKVQYEGVKGVNFKDPSFDFADYFNAFLPGEICNHLARMNKEIDQHNNKICKCRKSSTRKIKEVEECEYYVFIGLILLASIVNGSGIMLWRKDLFSILP